MGPFARCLTGASVIAGLAALALVLFAENQLVVVDRKEITFGGSLHAIAIGAFLHAISVGGSARDAHLVKVVVQQSIADMRCGGSGLQSLASAALSTGQRPLHHRFKTWRIVPQPHERSFWRRIRDTSRGEGYDMGAPRE